MKILQVTQGSQSWLDARKECFTASELPAAAGVSKYMSRAELLKQKATGIVPDVDGYTQALFDKGHAAEAAARIFAEEIIGEELSPLTGMKEIDGLKLLASFDGISFDHSITWECKLWNEKLVDAVLNKNLEPHYCLQLDQQLLISGASKCLFMVTDGTKENMVWMWYDTAQSDFEAICNVWLQFHKDLENYQHVEEKAAPVAEIIMGLPAVSVQATGMVTASNLPEFKKAADTFIANIKTELVTDEDFVNAEANVKFCKSAEDDLEGAKKSMLAQTSSINEVIQTIDFIKGQLAAKRLMLDKLVKSEKESRKLAIISEAKARHAEYIAGLESEIKPICMLVVQPDFAGAMKGLKKLSAMQESVDTVLRNAVFEADKIAKDIRAKLAWMNEYWFNNGGDYKFLFPDLQNLISKPMEDFTLTITSRIEKQKADEAARLEAERAKMQSEEEAKARAKVDAERIAEMKIQAEKLDALPTERVGEIMREMANDQRAKPQVSKSEQAITVLQDQVAKSKSSPPIKDAVSAYPGDQAIIKAIQSSFGVSYGAACDWIIETAESLQVTA